MVARCCARFPTTLYPTFLSVGSGHLGLARSLRWGLFAFAYTSFASSVPCCFDIVILPGALVPRVPFFSTCFPPRALVSRSRVLVRFASFPPRALALRSVRVHALVSLSFVRLASSVQRALVSRSVRSWLRVLSFASLFCSRSLASRSFPVPCMDPRSLVRLTSVLFLRVPWRRFRSERLGSALARLVRLVPSACLAFALDPSALVSPSFVRSASGFPRGLASRSFVRLAKSCRQRKVGVAHLTAILILSNRVWGSRLFTVEQRRLFFDRVGTVGILAPAAGAAETPVTMTRDTAPTAGAPERAEGGFLASFS